MVVVVVVAVVIFVVIVNVVVVTVVVVVGVFCLLLSLCFVVPTIDRKINAMKDCKNGRLTTTIAEKRHCFSYRHFPPNATRFWNVAIDAE